MFKQLNTYLRLNYPLLWNTRAIIFIALSLFLHALFFIAGFASMTTADMKEHYSLAGIGGGSLYAISVLCSIGVMIAWLVFYLRNNAYKQFYIISRLHLAAEFFIIVLIVFLSINYFDSFHAGAGLKITRMTNRQELVREVNTLNLAGAFLPAEKKPYFKYNGCDSNMHLPDNYTYEENFDYTDSTRSNYNSPEKRFIRKALLEPDAFSYRHYCMLNSTPIPGALTGPELSQVIQRIIRMNRRDTINEVLRSFMALSRKYHVVQAFNVNDKADWVFEDSLNTIRHLLGRDHWQERGQQEEVAYFSDLFRATSLAQDAHDGFYVGDFPERFLFEGYFALGLALLLFSYRLFSRRVFLSSILGSIVIGLLLLLAGSNETNTGTLYIALAVILLLAAVTAIVMRSWKTIAGVLLAIHLYMIPYIALIIVSMLDSKYYRMHISSEISGVFQDNDATIRSTHPFTWWVHHNNELVIGLNLLFVILYTAFVFTRLAKKQHMLANE